MKTHEVLALIPARSGSKGIPHKNIRRLTGKPLLAHSIEHALKSKLITRTIVSTDSQSYVEIAREYGAETPFLRPPDISQDLSTDLEVFEHALKWLKKNENYIPDICVHLRPTYPLRKVEDINKVIQVLIDDPSIDSARTVTLAPETPFKMWFRGNNDFLTPVIKTNIKDAHNLPRQGLPRVYLQNACIDAVRTEVILKKKSMTGSKIFGYIMNENLDIDSSSQWEIVKEKLEQQNNLLEYMQSESSKQKIFCFDIDGVISTIVPNNKYDLSSPMPKVIEAINTLYDMGYRIILYTARGSATGIDWSDLTKRQLKEWGVKYHELQFKKPPADYYIDDRMLSFEEFFNLVNIISKNREEKK